MLAVMAEPESKPKEMTGLRLAPDLLQRVRDVAKELTERAKPGRVTATDVMTQAIIEYLDRHDRQKAKAR